MGLAAYKTYVAGEVLTASDLNASLSRIHDNGEDLAWPATDAHSMGGYNLNLDEDADSSIGAGTNDQIAITIGGTVVNTIASAGIGGDSNVVIAIHVFS